MIMDQYRVVPMRLFATWEADRASSNCVPRLCTLSLTRLTVFKSLESDLNCLVIAVKLQGYKRTLRSNDISVIPVNGIIDVDLDISFTLHYPHFIKKKNNSLLVMLQRRRRYKNRPIPGGFKTLAVGLVNLTEVLQSSSCAKELNLYSDLDEEDVTGPSSSSYQQQHHRRHQPPATAKLYLHTLTSQPLEQDDAKTKEQQGEFTDEEEDDSTANDEGGSDSEHVVVNAGLMAEEGGGGPRQQRAASGARPGKVTSPSQAQAASGSSRGRFGSRQRNLKQKFVALLRKFKLSEEEVLKAVESSESQQPTEQEIRDLLEELDNYSNSDLEQDADTISVKSTPKPSLRPYFSSTTASRERLPIMENGGKESEDSKESGGDSPGDMDTTDPEQPESAPSVSISAPSPVVLRLGGPVEASASATVQQQLQQQAKISLSGSSSTSRGGAFSRPTAGRSSDKKKKVSPSNRQISVDAIAALNNESTSARHQSILERLHATSISSSRLRGSGRDSVGGGTPGSGPGPGGGFTFPTPLPHAPLADQLAQILPPDQANFAVPDVVVLLSAYDVHSTNLVQGIRDKLTTKLAILSGQADVKAMIGAVLNRIQKYCNTNVLQAQTPVKLIVLGSDRFFAQCLKSYTELLAQKSNDWLNYLRIFPVGPTWSVVCRYLCQLDHTYSSVFNDNFWRDWWDKGEMTQQDVFEIVSRMSRYLNNAKLMLQLPIAEAMLQLKDKRSNEEMSNIFVPFVVDVRRAAGEGTGYTESGQLVDAVFSPSSTSTLTMPSSSASVIHTSATGGPAAGGISGSPPAGAGNFTSPPTVVSSPRSVVINTTTGTPGSGTGEPTSMVATQNNTGSSPPGSPHPGALAGPGFTSGAGEAQDLQIEYWTTSTANQVPPVYVGPGGGSSHKKDLASSSSQTGSSGGGGGGIGGAIGGTMSAGLGGSGAGANGVGGSGVSAALSPANYPPTKYSLKTAFKSLIISRLPSGPSMLFGEMASAPASLVVQFIKEKKKDKVLQKLGMKNREKIESEQKSQSIDGISRLICSAKQHATLKLYIDGAEWTNVKFFQISAQWQTHVKYMPIGLFHIDS